MPASRSLVLALDVGTSSARAGCYDRRGRLLPSTECATPYVPAWTEDGGATLAPGALLAALAAAVDGALHAAVRLPGRPQPAAVGISTFWHSLMGVDGKGRAVTPVFLWADTRAGAVVPELKRRLGAGYHQRTGAPVHSTFWPAKLVWLRRTQPRPFARVARWMSFAEYLFLRWCGAPRCSVSMASATGLWNYRQCAWDQPALRAIGLSANRLTVVDDAPAPGLAGSWRRRWAPLADIPWFPAWGDGACANAGSGAVRAGKIAVTIGTSSALRAVVPAQRRLRLSPGLWRYALDARRHLVGAALSEGGNLFQWLRRELSWPPSASDAGLERRIAHRPPDGHGLTILPYFAGERSPGWSQGRRATIAGLTLATTSVDLLQAGLEAVALRLATTYQDLQQVLKQGGERRPEILAGGAALHRSSLWSQMLANAIGAPVRRLRVAETSARGAALMAWERLGTLPLDRAPVPRERLFRPRPAAVVALRAARHRQDHLRGLMS